MIVSGK